MVYSLGSHARHQLSQVQYIRRPYVFALALMALATANSALFLYFMERASIRVPVYDLMAWLQFYGVHARDGDWLGYFWAPHNEHRIVFSRALLALDVRWFGGSGTAFVLSGLLLFVAMIVALSREIMKSNLSVEWKLSAIPLSILTLMPTHEVVTLGMPAMSVYLQTSAFAMLALAMFGAPADNDDFLQLPRMLAIAAACFAAFGVSAGLDDLAGDALVSLAGKSRLSLDGNSCLRRRTVHSGLSA